MSVHATLRLFRAERWRITTSAANLLASRDRSDRLRVIRGVLGLAAAAGVVGYVARLALFPGPGAGTDAPAGRAVAQLLAALLLCDGVRRGAGSPPQREIREGWMPAVGIPPAARASADVLRAASAAVPFCWVPAMGVPGAMDGAGARTAVLAVGLSASMLGYGAGSVTRVLARPGRRVVWAALSTAAAAALALAWRAAAGDGHAPAPSSATIWGLFLSPHGCAHALATLAAAVATALALRIRTLGSLGRLPLEAPAAGVRAGREGAAPGPTRAVLEREVGRLLRDGWRDGLPAAVLGAATLAVYALRAARSPGFLTGSSLPLAVAFATLPPGILVSELVWRVESPELRAWLRAAARDERGVYRLRVAFAGGLLCTWGLALSVAAGVVTGDAERALRHALLAVAAAAAAAAGGSLAATHAMYAGIDEGLAAQVARYAGVAAFVAAVCAAHALWGPPAAVLGAALVAALAAVAAPGWACRAEIHPSRIT
jgi:hypothetical protein